MWVTVLGDAMIDIIIPIHNIKPGETYYRKISITCGGVANVAIQLAKLGESVNFVGNVGDDIFGRYFKEYLKSVGVRDLTFIDDKHNTGTCVSLTYENGERTMIVNKGANNYLSMNDISKCIDDIINSKIIYFSGYSLIHEIPFKSVVYAVEKAKKNGCKIYFNPGAPNIINERFRKIVKKFVDVLILNFDEARAFSEENEIQRVSKALAKNVELVVITLGEHGALLCNSSDIQHVPTTPLNVEDTTGAGDAFAAGFIAGKIRGLNDHECVKLGNSSALKFLKEKISNRINSNAKL